MAEKLFYSMGEVAEMFDVNPSLLRYWEEQFPALKPKRNRKGNRHYTPDDVELLKQIYHLVKERGMRLEGARKALREQRKAGGEFRPAELMERLQAIRAMLEQVRADLDGDGEPLSTDDEELLEPIDKGGQVVLKIEDDPQAEPAPSKPRRPRRKKEEGEKELFAFFEQSLF